MLLLQYISDQTFVLCILLQLSNSFNYKLLNKLDNTIINYNFNSNITCSACYLHTFSNICRVLRCNWVNYQQLYVNLSMGGISN